METLRSTQGRETESKFEFGGQLKNVFAILEVRISEFDAKPVGSRDDPEFETIARVFAQLIDAETGTTVWSATWDDTRTSEVSVPDVDLLLEVTETVMKALPPRRWYYIFYPW